MEELDSVAASPFPGRLEAIQGGEYSDDEIEALKAIASDDGGDEDDGDDGLNQARDADEGREFRRRRGCDQGEQGSCRG